MGMDTSLLADRGRALSPSPAALSGPPCRARIFPLLVFLMSLPFPVRAQGLEGEERAAESGTLVLAELLAIAQTDNPRVRGASHRVRASAVMVPEAGALPDPMLEVGAMNLSLWDFSATMPASMAPSFQLTQQFPLAGKRGLLETMADQSAEAVGSAAEEVWWGVRRDVSATFFSLYQVDRRLEVMRETLGLLQDFETVARALYSAGGGRQADVLRATVEVARMDAEIRRMEAMRKSASASLNALLDRPADTPLPTPLLPALPDGVPDLETLTGWARETRPLLAQMRLEVEQASTREELARRSIWPDLTVGLQYGLGRMGGSYQSMGGAMVGFGLPIHAGKRQYAARDEAQALRLSAEADLQEAQAQVGAQLAMELADLERSRTLLLLYREEILPQARATVESALNSYRAGTVDFMTLVDAQMAANQFQGEYFELISSYGTSLATLEMTIGRELPVADRLTVEDR